MKLDIEITDNVIRMKDAPTEMVFIKKSTSGSVLTGGQFVICDKNGTPMRALTDTAIDSVDHDGTIKQGEVLKFAATKDGINITRQLNGGETYFSKKKKHRPDTNWHPMCHLPYHETADRSLSP